ncbi:MAG: copper resistance protein CopC [Actinomycetota bacterium]|nr:copper resistance protein CopC [Actinomycetota bacterium]
MRIAITAVFIGALIASTGVAVAATPGNADLLVAADPDVDAVVTSAPSAVRLGFSEPIDPESASVRIYTSDGEPVAVGSADATGPSLEAPVEALGEGRYLVAWSVAGTDTGPATGGYFFTVDAAGLGTIGVDRQIEEISGTPGALRWIASLTAFIAGVLLVASLAVTALDQDADAAAHIVPAAAITAGAALVTLATYVVPPDGSIAELADLDSWRNVMSSTPGRAWLAVILSLAAVPLLALLRRDDPGAPGRTRWRMGAAFVGVVVLVGVAAGLGAAANAGSAVVALAFLVGVGGMVAWFSGQTVVAIIALAGLVTVAVVGEYLTRPVGHSEVAEAGSLVLEIDIEPAERGINEVHLYGFESSGGLAVLAPSDAWITHERTGAGPIRVPLVRAGPNHFLTYTADMPIAGKWHVEFATGRQDGEAARVDTIVNIR